MGALIEDNVNLNSNTRDDEVLDQFQKKTSSRSFYAGQCTMPQRKNCPRLASKVKNKNDELTTTIVGYKPH